MIRDLISAGFVDVLVSTGAIVYQDMYQAQGYKHYMGTPKADDAVLHDLYIDGSTTRTWMRSALWKRTT